jgi:multicomponent Na+:H+ antiporter subunit F
MVDLIIYLAGILAGLAFLLVLWRFIKGPGPVDRIIAFDGLTIVSITGILFAALAEQRGIYLDVALVYALLSFLGVIVVARFLERGF